MSALVIILVKQAFCYTFLHGFHTYEHILFIQLS